MTGDRVFGRTGERVPAVWHEREDGTIDAGEWVGLVVTADDLQRRAGDRVRARAATHGRPFDFFLARGLRAGDLKIGWPMHALLRFREHRMGRHALIDAVDALDAEWIAANAAVQGVVVMYTAADMAVRYRTFAAAQSAGVALVGRADSADSAGATDACDAAAHAAALHLATPELTATLLPAGIDAPPPLSNEMVDSLWSAYTAAHVEPPKPRSGHPPDD